MRLSYTDIKNQYLRNVGKAGSSETNLIADFTANLNQRYQMVLAKMGDYMTQDTKTASTVASQQYYAYPPGTANIESVKITIGSVTYVLDIITSQKMWDMINAIQIQPSSIPQFFFPRRDDFGIYPIPQDAYTITFDRHYRDRNLSIEDYTIGTFAATNGSAVITGTDTVFTEGMVGMWFTATTTTLPGWGYWYRVGSFSSTTSITLDQTWQSSALSGGAFKIVNSPEIPEEGHTILADGVTADFYAGIQANPELATWFENKFWTGSGSNPSRNENDPNVKSGLIGLMTQYSDRNHVVIVDRQSMPGLINSKIWGTVITGS